mmetsp:Transcript_39730/g.124081  ORF Transcript_39730/g.124081 Transcript_39730/m.124081 type:complete len:451 (+) Transcript_39730:31-1383(+)
MRPSLLRCEEVVFGRRVKVVVGLVLPPGCAAHKRVVVAHALRKVRDARLPVDAGVRRLVHVAEVCRCVDGLAREVARLARAVLRDDGATGKAHGAVAGTGGIALEDPLQREQPLDLIDAELLAHLVLHAHHRVHGLTPLVDDERGQRDGVEGRARNLAAVVGAHAQELDRRVPPREHLERAVHALAEVDVRLVEVHHDEDARVHFVHGIHVLVAGDLRDIAKRRHHGGGAHLLHALRAVALEEVVVVVIVLIRVLHGLLHLREHGGGGAHLRARDAARCAVNEIGPQLRLQHLLLVLVVAPLAVVLQHTLDAGVALLADAVRVVRVPDGLRHVLQRALTVYLGYLFPVIVVAQCAVHASALVLLLLVAILLPPAVLAGDVLLQNPVLDAHGATLRSLALAEAAWSLVARGPAWGGVRRGVCVGWGSVGRRVFGDSCGLGLLAPSLRRSAA